MPKPKDRKFYYIVGTTLAAVVFGSIAGLVSSNLFFLKIKDSLFLESSSSGTKTIIEKEYLSSVSHEEAVITVVNDISPAVVSIVATKDVPIIEQYFYNPFEEFEQFFGMPFSTPQYQEKGTEKKEVGGGTGFIVSEEGLVLTNKHVVIDAEAAYTVFTNDGSSYTTKVLALDPVQDIAVLQIEYKGKQKFPMVRLADSDYLKVGQTVIAIGNALGEFKNTVSVGVVSGLSRTITASGGGVVETLEDVIQTDAAINLGNSGGPLLNLKGEVIGINTAMAVEAQSIGFAIPINKAKRDITQVKELGKIVYPFLGIRYRLITKNIQEENNLTVDYGAWVQGGDGESAITPGSAAEKAGLKEGDIVLELNGEKITSDNSLAKLISKYNPKDKIELKILRNKKEQKVTVTLGERSE